MYMTCMYFGSLSFSCLSVSGYFLLASLLACMLTCSEFFWNENNSFQLFVHDEVFQDGINGDRVLKGHVFRLTGAMAYGLSFPDPHFLLPIVVKKVKTREKNVLAR